MFYNLALFNASLWIRNNTRISYAPQFRIFCHINFSFIIYFNSHTHNTLLDIQIKKKKLSVFATYSALLVGISMETIPHSQSHLDRSMFRLLPRLHHSVRVACRCVRRVCEFHIKWFDITSLISLVVVVGFDAVNTRVLPFSLLVNGLVLVSITCVLRTHSIRRFHPYPTKQQTIVCSVNEYEVNETHSTFFYYHTMPKA